MGPSTKLAGGDGDPAKPNHGVKGMHEGYSGLYFVSSTGGKGLPLELFLGVMRHVRAESELYLIRTSHVCPGWRKAIVECPDLWSDLDQVCIGSAKDLERLRTFATRSKGFLRRFKVLFQPTSFEQDPASVLLALKEVYREISERDGARQLARLRIDFRDLQRLGEPETILNCLVHTIHFVELAAVRLRSLRMDTRVERFPAGATVLNALPKLEQLTITSRPFVSGDVRLPDFFQQVASADTVGARAVHLRKLTLAGVSLPDSAFPEIPEIRQIKLYDVQCCNLLGLLGKVADTLEALWLFEVEADPANRYLPPAPDGVTQKDVPAALDLPRLVDLRLAGGSTPSLWTAPNPTSSDFVITAPAVSKVSLGWQFPFDHEDDDDDEAWIPPAKRPTVEALATLFRNTPALTKLNLTSCDITAQTLLRSLAFAPSSLTTLCLGGTSAATDDCLDRLHVLVPSLKYLDVFSPIGSSGEPSLAALARFANRLKQRRSLTSWIGAFHLTMIAREPAEGRDLAADLRNQVRAILLTLSPAQVSHVPSRLTVNPPPNAPTFAEIEDELIALTAPPPKPPLSVNGVADGQPAANGPPNRPAGTQQVFDDACKLAQRWIQEREDDLAVQFCRQTLGIDLRWGHGCDDWCYDSHSQHPGFSEWHVVAGDDEDDEAAA